MKFDFSGYATKNDLRCGDGRIIRRDAFKDNDGKRVPLVYQHNHSELSNVIGHTILENRSDGVYAYGYLNNSSNGKLAREALKHGDIDSMSIYANQLRQDGPNVIHGSIKEVSLVLAGANPGAKIDNLNLLHSDGMQEEIEDEAIIHTGLTLDNKIQNESEDTIKHTDTKSEELEEKPMSDDEETVDDVFNTFTDEEKKVAYFLIGQAVAQAKGEPVEEEVSHADIADGLTVQDVFDNFTEKQKNVVYALIGYALENVNDVEHSDEGDFDMYKNVFDGTNSASESEALTHAEMEEIFADAKRLGSLADAVMQHDAFVPYLQHDGEYGVTNIGNLFPDYRNVENQPSFIKRDTGWVSSFMTGTRHLPFSRVKMQFADLREDAARALGYTKGKLKKEEVITLLKRTVDPQTIYKKQKLDRDDVVDITDFDVVVWLKGEMRMMLDEEIARAALVGDGRLSSSDDKIDETHIIPIWKDAALYTVAARLTTAQASDSKTLAENFIKAAIRARKDYKGSGNPNLYTTEDMLTEMLLLTDSTGRDLYDSVEKLAIKLRVKEIITVEPMEGQTRAVDGVTYALDGIIVNPVDYAFGADKGGAVNMFDDFDIDYNQQKYLIETRCSGALTKPFSALVIEHDTTVAAG